MPARMSAECERNTLSQVNKSGQLDRYQDDRNGQDRRDLMREIFVIDETKEGCRQAGTVAASKEKRHGNALRKYTNRLYLICLLNVLATLILAYFYIDTKNETIYAAMTVCEVNALLSWWFVER